MQSVKRGASPGWGGNAVATTSTVMGPPPPLFIVFVVIRMEKRLPARYVTPLILTQFSIVD